MLACALACASAPPAALLDRVDSVALISGGASLREKPHARGRGESALLGAGSATAEAIGQCGGAGGHGDFAAVGLVLCLGLATLIGGLGGGVAGALEGLPSEAVRELNDAIEQHLAQEDLQSQFLQILSARVARLRTVSNNDPDLVLVVTLREVRLEQHVGRQLSLALAASVQLEFPELPSGKRSYERGYRYEGRRRHIDGWLAERGSGVITELRAAFAGLSDEIVHDLWGPHARRARPKKVLVPADRPRLPGYEDGSNILATSHRPEDIGQGSDLRG